MSTYQHTLDQLTDLNFKGFKEALISQKESPNYAQMSFDERLSHLIDAEHLYRRNSRIKQYLRKSKLKYKQALLEDITYPASRNLNRTMMLELANNDWLEHHHHIIITGATGTGKTYIACALAIHGICQGHTAYYCRISRLLSEIKVARADGSYLSYLKRITKMRILVLDDFGVSPMDAADVQELLEVIEDRVDLGSIIITSQLPVDQWYDYLNNATMADAVLDRLIHNSYRLNLQGESMRKLNSNLNQRYES